jgi:ribosomal protein S18 acetylase RimI-like enzyme
MRNPRPRRSVAAALGRLGQAGSNQIIQGTAPWFTVAVIRDTTEDDWRLLRRIRLQALQDSPDSFASDYGAEVRHNERQWREWLRSDMWLLAFESGTAPAPVGIIAATREPPAQAGEPFLSSLWVDPWHRRRGIARGLVEAAAEAAAGATAVSLWVLDGNEEARRFYAAIGFVPTGERQLAPGAWDLHERRMRRTVR